MNNLYYSDWRVTIALILTVIILFIISGFSPVLGFILGICLLAIGLGQNLIYRFTLYLYTTFNLAFIGASKKYMNYDVYDDFGNIYLPLYYHMASGGSIFFHEFSGGFEFFLPLFYKILSFYSPILHPSQILAAHSILICMLFYIWLENYGFSNIKNYEKSLGLAFSIILFSSDIYLHLMRQSLSTIFILFALSTFIRKKYFLAILFILIGSISHITTLFIFLIYLFFLNASNLYKNFVILIIALMTLFFENVLDFIIGNSLLGPATYKFSYYKNIISSLDFTKYNFSSTILVIYLLSIFFMRKCDARIKNLLLYMLIIGIILSPLDQLSLRILNLIFLISGYLLFLSVYKLGVSRIFIILFLICIKSLDFIILSDGNVDLPSHLFLWYSYPWANEDLFYYLR